MPQPEKIPAFKGNDEIRVLWRDGENRYHVRWYDYCCFLADKPRTEQEKNSCWKTCQLYKRFVFVSEEEALEWKDKEPLESFRLGTPLIAKTPSEPDEVPTLATFLMKEFVEGVV